MYSLLKIYKKNNDIHIIVQSVLYLRIVLKKGEKCDESYNRLQAYLQNTLSELNVVESSGSRPKSEKDTKYFDKIGTRHENLYPLSLSPDSDAGFSLISVNPDPALDLG
jgi:hypothetical protein